MQGSDKSINLRYTKHNHNSTELENFTMVANMKSFAGVLAFAAQVFAQRMSSFGVVESLPGEVCTFGSIHF